MSSEAEEFKVRITTIGVPPTLQGVWLPIEIIPQEGEAKQTIIPLEENRTEIELVESPGSYLVRAVLPSGQLIAKTVVVPQSSERQGEAQGDVTLDFEGYIPAAAAHERAVIKDQLKAGWFKGLFRKIVPPNLPDRLRSALNHPQVLGGGSKSRVALRYGWFDNWNAEGAGESKESSADTLVIKPSGKEFTLPDRTTLPGHIEMSEHPGWTPNSELWRPLLIRVRFKPSAGRSQEALIVYPPSNPPLPVQLLPPLRPDLNSMAPALLAYSDSDNRELDAMFKYIRGGDLQRARQLVPRMIERAQDMLQSKVANPVNATLAAYVLLKVSNAERIDWVRNLANWFEHLPDGAIIYGWFLIRDGQAENAHDYFTKALKRGLPMYTEGVRLLRDGLNFLSGLYPTNSAVQADAARANRISDLTNLDSNLTCLRLGKGLVVKETE